MKKSLKSIILALCVSSAMFCAISAADNGATVYGGRVYIEGLKAMCQDESGRVVPYLSYNDSTYIPVRTAGEWAGKAVEWNGETQTIKLTSGEKPKYIAFDNDLKMDFKAGDNAQITQRADIRVIIDAVEQKFINQRNEPIYPIMYNNVTYLPLRNIGEITGMSVEWARPSIGNDFIFMRMPATKAQVTEIREYISNQCILLEKSDLLIKEIRKDGDNAKIKENADVIEQLKNMKKPSASFAQYAYNRRMEALSEVEALSEKMQKTTDESEIKRLANEMLKARMGVYASLIELSQVTEQTGKPVVPYVLTHY